MMILTFLMWPGYFLVPLSLNQRRPPPNIGQIHHLYRACCLSCPFYSSCLPSTTCTLKYSANTPPIASPSTNLGIMPLILFLAPHLGNVRSITSLLVKPLP